MAYEPYSTTEYYTDVYGGSLIPGEKLLGVLRQASRQWTPLRSTRDFWERIFLSYAVPAGHSPGGGRQQADFEYENADEISTILSSYSINGVSAQFGSSWNVFTEHGVAMKRDTYALLCQTGLCCRLVG